MSTPVGQIMIRWRLAIGTCVLLAAGLLGIFTSPALARHLASHSFSSSFAAPFGAPGGGYGVASVAVSEDGGYVYLENRAAGLPLEKYTATGTPSSFTDPAANSSTTIEIPGGSGSPSVEVDNSGSPTAGRIYVASQYPGVVAFEASGERLAGNFPIEPEARDVSIEPGTGNLWVLKTGSSNATVTQYTPAGEPTGEQVQVSYAATRVAVDSLGTFYFIAGTTAHRYAAATQQDQSLGTGKDVAVDPQSDDAYVLRSNNNLAQYGFAGSILVEFGSPPLSTAGNAGLAVNGSSGLVYRLIGGNVEIFEPGGTIIVPDVTTGGATDFHSTTTVVHGSTNPDSGPTTECYFQWGVSTSYGQTTTCAEGNVLSGSSEEPVTSELTGLAKGTLYHYRLVVANTSVKIVGLDQTFRPSEIPTFGDEHVTDVHSDTVVLRGAVSPEGADTTYRFEYGLEDCAVSVCDSTPIEVAPSGVTPQDKSAVVAGLQAGTTYHYRLVAENQSGSADGSDHTFNTFESILLTNDPCPNAHVRQQTGAALLLNCRAYELVSAANAGGYDVESDLVSGQEPYEGYPDATGRVLYGTHGGGIPGSGNPTTYGVDPYVATRGGDGWTTSYVGIPANGTPSLTPFASTLLEADSTLDTFAFGGKELCDPCFSDGSTNIPLRMPDGSLIKGMTGSFNPAADPVGEVRKPLSSDGSHLIFGSEDKFEEGGNEGSVSIYDRDLVANTTQIVSTKPNGETMTGTVAELDVSADGSRVVVGELLGTDVDGNELFHLYMHIGNNQGSYDLTPSTSTGVLYNGMTEDGSMVYFSTKDPILTAADQDTDESVDLFRSTVDPNGAVAVNRVSTGTGGTGDTDLCAPVGDADWNSNEGAGKCNTLALAGGAGVAAEDGTVFFVSPERLDGTGNGSEVGEPNLYVADPEGVPHYVGLLDSSTVKPPPAPPVHSLSNANFVTGLGSPGEMAIDQNTGEIYVNDRPGKVSRFDSAGNPSEFSALGSNTLTGQSLSGAGEGQVAVDSAPGSPLNGAFYVTTATAKVRVFDNDGTKIGEITAEGEVCGVSVDQANGDVYLGMYSNKAFRFKPLSKSPLEYGPKEQITAAKEQCNLDAASPGSVYLWGYGGGAISQYPKSAFTVAGTSPAPTNTFGNGVHAQTDPATGDLYVNEGNKITRYDSSGNFIESFGSGSLSSSRGVAIDLDSKDVFATSSGGVIKKYSLPAPYDPIDNPAIENALHQSAVHSYRDFQVTPDGRYAAFSSLVPLTGHDNGGHYEVFRYDVDGEELVCVSCNPTNARAVGDSELPAKGLGLDASGRVFFDSADAIAARDLDEKVDAYEYEDGELQLISTGASPFDSRMLGVSADGVDALFFTRDALVQQDENGDLVKIYDARVGGGFDYVPPPAPCRASDECHGAGTAAPPAPEIRTIRGSGGNESRASSRRRCKGHRVRRKGRCVTKRHHRKHRRHNGRHRRGARSS